MSPPVKEIEGWKAVEGAGVAVVAVVDVVVDADVGDPVQAPAERALTPIRNESGSRLTRIAAA